MERRKLPWKKSALALGLGAGLLGASMAMRTAEPAMTGDGGDGAGGGGRHVACGHDGLPTTGAGLGPEWDLPNLDHPRIDYWVDRFQNVPEMREKFEGFLERGAEWAPYILERLEARGMPLDLLYLAMIESGFNPQAVSHASAVGVWQFMRPTGASTA
jgi:hypothetical protein